MATPSTTPFFGMRGTGDWVSDQRPKNWREMILYLYPNGMAPLTAIMSMMKSESTDDPEFNWWTKALPSQAADITGIYTDALSTAYDGTTIRTSGELLWLKMAAADVDHFREGHCVELRVNTDGGATLAGKVIDKAKNGANSYITIRLLEDDPDDDSDTNGDVGQGSSHRALIIGNINPEGGFIPDAIAYDPTKYYNYTQIFRTPLEITRTARKTRLRTGDAYKEAKREALELHSIEMEKARIFGRRTEGTGDNNKPERTSMGLIQSIKTFASANIFTYTTDTDSDFAGKSWEARGQRWFEEKLEVIFRYGRTQKMAICGSGALLGVQRLADAKGWIQIAPRQTVFGIQVTEWVTPFGTLTMKTHPLFSYEESTRHMMVIFEPENLIERYIDQTQFIKDKVSGKAGQQGFDGSKDEYLTEDGMEFHHPITGGIFHGVGKDNTATAA